MSNGRFGHGNRAAKGNPHARRVQRLRAELLKAVTPDCIRRVVDALLREAEAGNVLAARELLDRTIGREPVAVTLAATEPKPPTIGEPLYQVAPARQAEFDEWLSLALVQPEPNVAVLAAAR